MPARCLHPRRRVPEMPEGRPAGVFIPGGRRCPQGGRGNGAAMGELYEGYK